MGSSRLTSPDAFSGTVSSRMPQHSGGDAFGEAGSGVFDASMMVMSMRNLMSFDHAGGDDRELARYVHGRLCHRLLHDAPLSSVANRR